LLCVGSATSACSVYDESLLESKSEFDPKSCAWGDCWWSEPGAGCRSVGQPTTTERPVASGEAEQEIVVALRRVWLGQSRPPGAAAELEPWQSVGLDLDGLCTRAIGCEGQPVVAACANDAGVSADGAGCRDNAFAQLFPAAAATPLGTTYGISEDKLNCGLHRGSFSLLIRISGYGGGLDDSNVRVDVHPSPGLEQPMPILCDGPLDWKSQLGWLTPLPWQLDEAMLEASGSSKISDPFGYVKNGYLVAQLPDGAVLALVGDSAPYSGLSLRLFGAILTARIGRDADGAWMLQDGLIAGRLPRADFITSIRQAGFCESTVGDQYGAFVSSIDASLDLLASGANAESAPCDALSVGIGFEAIQATVGISVSVAPPAECAGN
jgi:hypothetical protein